MIVKQKNLRVFHISIDDKESFLVYLEKNRALLMEFFLLIDGKFDESIENILNNEGFCYKNISTCRLRLTSAKKEIAAKVEASEAIVLKQTMKTYDRPIRSGEEISEELPITVFGRINSGAKLYSTQSVSIYGEIDGLVQCDGEFVVLGGLTKRGNLIFNGEIIEREFLKKGTLQKVMLKNNKLNIKGISASNNSC